MSIESTHAQVSEIDPLDEMKQLLANAERFSSTVKRELDELIASRDELVVAVQSESVEIRAAAMAAAEATLSDAEARAAQRLAEADIEAEAMLRDARAERDSLGKVNGEYLAALATLREAVGAVEGISEELDASPIGEAGTAGESTEVEPAGTDPHEIPPHEAPIVDREASDVVDF